MSKNADQHVGRRRKRCHNTLIQNYISQVQCNSWTTHHASIVDLSINVPQPNGTPFNFEQYMLGKIVFTSRSSNADTGCSKPNSLRKKCETSLFCSPPDLLVDWSNRAAWVVAIALHVHALRCACAAPLSMGFSNKVACEAHTLHSEFAVLRRKRKNGTWSPRWTCTTPCAALQVDMTERGR